MACTIDFRNLDEGLGGKTLKRKRSEQESIKIQSLNPINEDSSSMDIDNSTNPPTKRQAIPSLSNADKPSFGNPTYDGVIAGRVSGRKWKDVRTKRASSIQVKKGTTLEQRVREKAVNKAYKERKNELKEEIRKNKIEKRLKREEREKVKKENVLRSGMKLQKVTNPKTLKKIAKSNKRKLLKMVPDDVFNKKK